MKKPIFIFLIFITCSAVISCNEDEEVIAPTTTAAIITDISVATNVTSISWIDANDLMQKLTNALSYNYGSALESEIEKSLSFNSDSTQVNAKIDFKQAFQNVYNDTNLANNALNISLIRQNTTTAGVSLIADGPGDTYSLITSVLAPGANPIETPDCSHNAFGEHIDEVFDTDLNANVFRFFIHTTPDDDRCINFDRQRNEIKTYNQSPDNLLGIENEKVVYNWKFKLKAGFQSSSSFTHLHQLKSVGGEFESMPMYTLTARKSSPDRLELRYAVTDTQITLDQTDLAPLVDTWLEVTETIEYGTSGTYNIEIKKVSDNTMLFSYSNNDIVNWRPNATFVRPKWGIYRSLNSVQDLRDEEVLFADFNITEIE